METEEENLQIQGVLGALSSILGGAVHAVYLHGSAVSGGLQPQSDIDLLVITSRPMSLRERQGLLSRLLALSGRTLAKRSNHGASNFSYSPGPTT
jgi:predicted nucleotidyltransferase